MKYKLQKVILLLLALAVGSLYFYLNYRAKTAPLAQLEEKISSPAKKNSQSIELEKPPFLK